MNNPPTTVVDAAPALGESDDGQQSSPQSSEYETDSEAEPEEFYITLDLSIPQPVHAGPSSNPFRNPTASTSAASKHTTTQKSTYVLGATRSQQTRHHVSEWARTASSARRDCVQILGLDSDNPLVSYQNRIWSGQWARVIGTEMYIESASTKNKGPADGNPDISVDTNVPAGILACGVPRLSGGGFYYSEKDVSMAAAYVGGRRGTVTSKPPQAMGLVGTGGGGGGWGGDGKTRVDTDRGKVFATADTRIHFRPATVKAKEWPFSEQLQGKSDFLRRLEMIKIQRGEIGEEAAIHQERKRKRIRKGMDKEREKEENGTATEMAVTADEDENEGSGWGSGSHDDDDCDDDDNKDGDPGPDGGLKEAKMVDLTREENSDMGSDSIPGGYFHPGWNKDVAVENSTEEMPDLPPSHSKSPLPSSPLSSPPSSNLSPIRFPPHSPPYPSVDQDGDLTMI